MLQSFVITLREGIEAALAIAIVLAYLKRSGRSDLSKWVYGGLWAALLASTIAAVIIHTLHIDMERYEGYLLVTGAVLVGSMTYWMWRGARGIKGEIEGKLGRLLSGQSDAAIPSETAMAGAADGRTAIGLFLFVFLMVGREGAETILFLSAVSLNTAAILSFLGGVLGLTAAVVFGVLFVRGSIRINLRQFFAYTTGILCLVSAQLLINGLHELSEAHILPSSSSEMAVVGPIVNNDVYFFIGILFLAGVLFLSNRPARPEPSPDQVGRAAWRLQLADYQRQQRVRLGGGLTVLLLCVALTVDLVHERALARPPAAQPVTLQGNAVLIPDSSLRDGRLHFYRVMLQEKPVTFMAVRSQPGRVRTAFDACGICTTTFFYQSGDNVICSNCGAALYLPSVGDEGGCNPLPLESTLHDGYLTISRTALLKQIGKFQVPIRR